MSDKSPTRYSPGTQFGLMQRLSQISALAITWLLMRAIFATLLPYRLVRNYLDQRAGDGSADLYTDSLHGRVVTAFSTAVWLGIALLIIVWMNRRRLSAHAAQLGRELTELSRSLGSSLRSHGLIIIAVMLVALGLRWPWLHLPMRFDESYTWLNYSSAPIYVTVSKYDSPNNHIFHSLLEWLSVRILGNEPWAIRMPALLCGIGTAGVTAWWTSRRSGFWAGLVAGMVVACSSILIEYSVNARGYTLSHLLLMLLWVLADEWQDQSRTIIPLFMAVLASLAMWTMPISLYGLLVVGVVIWFSRPACPDNVPVSKHPLLGGAILAVVLTLLMYSPVFVVWGVRAVAGAGQGSVSGLSDWANQLIPSLREAAKLLFRDIPSGCSVVVIPLAMAAVVRRAARIQRLTGLVLIGLLVCGLLVTIQQIVPPPRSWLFLIPLISGLICSLVAGDVAGVSKDRRGVSFLFIVLGVGAAIPVIECYRHDSILHSREAARFDSADAVVRALLPRVQVDEPIISVTPVSAPLAYYGKQLGLADQHFFPPGTGANQRTAWVVMAREPEQSVEAVLRELKLTDVYRHHRLEMDSEWPDGRVFRLIPPEQ